MYVCMSLDLVSSSLLSSSMDASRKKIVVHSTVGGGHMRQHREEHLLKESDFRTQGGLQPTSPLYWRCPFQFHAWKGLGFILKRKTVSPHGISWKRQSEEHTFTNLHSLWEKKFRSGKAPGQTTHTQNSVSHRKAYD